MTENKYKFNIKTSNNGQLTVPLSEGKPVFVLGANGVGKSTLMHNIYAHNRTHARRILAHRQTWFTSNSMDMTAANKKQTETYITNQDQQITSRWRDDYSAKRSSISIFDLINSENIRARDIAKAVDDDNIDSAKKLSNAQAPIQGINELLAISNIPIVISLGKDEQLFASKSGSPLYSIAELSDGERNALLIAADVLTCEPNTLIIIDEPERHLHRAIISPLLSSLFLKRDDCAFVISTHDIFLPIDNLNSSTLLVRNCHWNGKNIDSWDADLISELDPISSNIKKSILGAKRDILFVEGKNDSLDRQIYQLIYPNVTVIPKDSCKNVEKAVEGISSSESLHWINAFGLIDADDRTAEQIQELKERGIIATNCYSVESLYYNLNIIQFVSEKYGELTGTNSEDLYKKATAKIVSDINSHKERLCSRLSEKRVRTVIMSMLPKHTDIIKKEGFEIKLDLENYYNQEEAVFNQLIADENLNGLIKRYPIRETPVLNNIAKGLGIDRATYENIVRKLIIDNPDVLSFFRKLLTELTTLVIKE
ncbi:AAA family ATPase [Flavobacteriaceae bacterium]|nr:AAA family ATPase [Flavobacteriaceae bacterium]